MEEGLDLESTAAMARVQGMLSGRSGEKDLRLAILSTPTALRGNRYYPECDRVPVPTERISLAQSVLSSTTIDSARDLGTRAAYERVEGNEEALAENTTVFANVDTGRSAKERGLTVLELVKVPPLVIARLEAGKSEAVRRFAEVFARADMGSFKPQF